MKKNILYFLIGTVFSFCTQQKGQATDSPQITDTSISSSPLEASKKTIWANHLPPLGEGEIALFQNYREKDGTPVDIHKMRTDLMYWADGDMEDFMYVITSWSNIPKRLGKGLYKDYNSVYKTFSACYHPQNNASGKDQFVSKISSQFNLEEDYVQELYNALKPSDLFLESQKEQIKQTSPKNELVAAKTALTQKEKEQTLEAKCPYIPTVKPFVGLRRRNLSPPE